MEQLFVLTVLFAVPSNYPRIKTHYHMYLVPINIHFIS